MTLSRSRLSVVKFCLAVAVFFAPAAAVADTYQFFELGTAGSMIYGKIVLFHPTASCDTHFLH